MDPVTIGLLLTALGTGASYLGKRQAASAQRKTMAQAMERARSRQKQATVNNDAAIEAAGPQQLQQEVDRGQQMSAAEAAKGQQIASAFADTSAPNGSAAYRGTISDVSANAAQAAGRSGSNQAMGRSFASAMANRRQGLQQLQHTNSFLAEDQARDEARLPMALDRAGRNGAGLRLAGQVAGAGGMGLMNYGFWQPTAAGANGASAGLAGDGGGMTGMVPVTQPNGSVVWRMPTGAR